MKMIQTEMSSRPTTEVFYDGVLRVDYTQDVFGVVELPRKKGHWRDVLLMRGYRDVVEEPVVEEKPPVTDDSKTSDTTKEKPKRQTRRKKVSNGEDE